MGAGTDIGAGTAGGAGAVGVHIGEEGKLEFHEC